MRNFVSEFKEKMAYLSLVTGTVFYHMLRHAQCSHSIDGEQALTTIVAGVFTAD